MKITKFTFKTVSSDTEWWDSQTLEFQEEYIKAHPKTKRKVTAEKGKKSSKSVDEKAVKVKHKPEFYSPDVEKVDEDGITHSARVGIPGKKLLPPPAIPRLPNLTKLERAVESKFARDFEKHPKKLASDFLEMVTHVSPPKPPTFGTDDAKMLTAEWAGDPGEERSTRRATLNTALHQTANAVAKRAFVMYLDTLKKEDTILVTVGGCGAGKGYSLGNVDIAKNAAAAANAVWDSAGDQNATENPWIQEEAEKRGLKVTYVYVHADPKVSWADPNRGVIKRANNPEDGRMVDADVFADSYAIGAKNHQAFASKHKNNPNAKFIYIDSENKAPTLVDTMPDSATSFDRRELASFAKKALQEADAPEHIKQGGSIGSRIWKERSAETSFSRRPFVETSNDKKSKYSWKQHEKDEIERLKKLAAHPNAGKYGGGYKKQEKTPVVKPHRGLR